MAKIQNHSKFTLAVLAQEFSGFVSPKSTAEVPDDVAEAWSTKTNVRAFVDAGLLDVRLDGSTASAPASSPALDLAGMSARKVIGLVEDESDLDVLAELHASESRKTVLSAIEARMNALR